MKWLLILFIILSAGCSLRVFQDKVPPPVEKQNRHIDEERKSAYWLAQNVDEPKPAKGIAENLSSSLGYPSEIEADGEVVEISLSKLLSTHQAEQDALKKKLTELDGAEIEGTGFNLLPAMSGLGIVGIIALCIFCPALITVGVFVIKRLKSCLSTIVKAIDEHTFIEPASAKLLKEKLSREMDKSHKKLVEGIRHD
jgi:hypothetical protein